MVTADTSLEVSLHKKNVPLWGGPAGADPAEGGMSTGTSPRCPHCFLAWWAARLALDFFLLTNRYEIQKKTPFWGRAWCSSLSSLSSWFSSPLVALGCFGWFVQPEESLRLHIAPAHMGAYLESLTQPPCKGLLLNCKLLIIQETEMGTNTFYLCLCSAQRMKQSGSPLLWKPQ